MLLRFPYFAALLLTGCSDELVTPVRSSGAEPPDPYLRALSVATRSGHTCAALDDHRVACWGKGKNGDLGDGIANADPYDPGHVVTVPKIVPGITTATRV